MTSSAEAGRTEPFTPFMVEALTPIEASIAVKIAKNFDGLKTAVLEPLSERDAEYIAQAINEKDERMYGPLEHPENGRAIFERAQANKAEGSPGLPVVIIQARVDADGGSHIFEQFNSRLNQEWKRLESIRSQAGRTAQKKSMLSRFFGKIGIKS